jgi:hypothetical protein
MRAMSLLPAFINAQKHENDSSPSAKAKGNVRDLSTDPTDATGNVFDLVPPASEAAAESEPASIGRNKHPVDRTDLSRLSIERDGRLYWDGKPVEVSRVLMMTRAQIIYASLIAVFVVIGALESALQGVAAARNLTCRVGRSNSCPPAAPRLFIDIPAQPFRFNFQIVSIVLAACLHPRHWARLRSRKSPRALHSALLLSPFQRGTVQVPGTREFFSETSAALRRWRSGDSVVGGYIE